jgi:hypothetical protein
VNQQFGFCCCFQLERPRCFQIPDLLCKAVELGPQLEAFTSGKNQGTTDRTCPSRNTKTFLLKPHSYPGQKDAQLRFL